MGKNKRCVFCRRENKTLNRQDYEFFHDWGPTGDYDYSLIEISLIKMKRPIIAYNQIKISYDVCPDCFEKKLIPWIESQKKGVES